MPSINRSLNIANSLYCTIVAAFSLFSLPLSVSAQAIETGYEGGNVLKFDSWLTNDALKRQDARGFWVGYVYQTSADEECGYASDYNYPAFTFGLLIADFNKVRLRYNPAA